MDYKVLARKLRPQVFAEVVGQVPVVQALQYALQSGRLPHAYLFTGTRGVGKTTIARILAKALSCERGVLPEPCNSCAICQAIDAGKYMDVLEIDAASRTKVEDTRELLDNVPYAPGQGRYKIYIIDEVHMLSNHSFNALLKTLEEPPQHVKFLFATTDPQKLPITMLSRCIQFNLSVFTVIELVAYLQQILIAEKIDFELSAVQKIARTANGSIRDALTLLEQVIALGQGAVTDLVVGQILGIANYDIIMELLLAIINKQPVLAFAVIEQLTKAAVDFSKVLQELAAMLHKLAVSQVIPGYLTEQENTVLASIVNKVAPEEIQLLYQIAIQGKKDLPYAPELKLGFEMVVLRMLAFQPLQLREPISEPVVDNSNEVVLSAKPQETPNKATAIESADDIAAKTLEIPTAIGSMTDLAAKTVTISKLATMDPVADIAAKPPETSKAIESADDIAANLPETSNKAKAIESADNMTLVNWEEVIDLLQLSGLTKTVAQHCTIRVWQDNKIVLALTPVHKALLQQHHEHRIQQALQQYLGHPVQLTIIIGQTNDSSTPAAKQQQQQRQAQQAAEALVKNNANVQELLTVFNAKLEKVTIKEEIEH